MIKKKRGSIHSGYGMGTRSDSPGFQTRLYHQLCDLGQAKEPLLSFQFPNGQNEAICLERCPRDRVCMLGTQ